MCVPPTNGDLLNALHDTMDTQLGPGGWFSRLGRERTEEILLLLLNAGRVVKAHTRVWETPVPPDLIPAVRAAGGFLSSEEYKTARAAQRGT